MLQSIMARLLLVYLLSSVGVIEAREKSRLITIGGGISELVCALDFCDEIVAVDATSTFPKSLQNLPNLGYYRQLNAEGILQQKADLILLTDQAGPPPVMAHMQRLGLPLHVISSEKSVEGAKLRIQQIGKLLQAEEKAEKLLAKMEQDLALAVEQSKASKQNGVSVVWLVLTGLLSPA
ncbi:MAG: ABC transporter substrate-binding protein [Oligoflexus sp.]